MSYFDYLKTIRTEMEIGLFAGIDVTMKELHDEHIQLENIKNTLENTMRQFSKIRYHLFSVPLGTLLTPLFIRYLTGIELHSADFIHNTKYVYLQNNSYSHIPDKFSDIILNNSTVQNTIDKLNRELSGLVISTKIRWDESNSPILYYLVTIPEFN